MARSKGNIRLDLGESHIFIYDRPTDRPTYRSFIHPSILQCIHSFIHSPAQCRGTAIYILHISVCSKGPKSSGVLFLRFHKRLIFWYILTCKLRALSGFIQGLLGSILRFKTLLIWGLESSSSDAFHKRGRSTILQILPIQWSLRFQKSPVK